MQKLILRHGDCVAVLAGMKEDSVGSIVCDPPYGLEFMGKKWDRLDWTDGGGMVGVGMGGREIPWPSYSGTGAAGTANATCVACGGRMRGGNKCSCDKPDWRVKGQPINLSANAERMQKQQHSHRIWLTEVYRALRPGGVIKAFSGTRTFHRMAAAMQQAGFVDLRVESWNYGCLSEDTEVLTRNGWEPYRRATVGTEIMGFDPMSEEFRWMPVEDTYEYAYDREAYRLVGEGSDHIVSTNHRCLVERDGEWSFVYAEQLEDTEVVPCVSVQGVRLLVLAHLERSTVRVERIGYKGMVWCVKVPTGAFVARRNGMAFVTGNSGFPKSKNIGKALDKQAGRVNTSTVTLMKELRALFDASGKSRTTIDKECGFRACNYLSYPEPGKRLDPWFNVLPSQAKWQVMKQVLGVEGTDREVKLDGFFYEAEREVIGFKKVVPGVAFSSDGPSEMPVTLPATDAARLWDGWGTALKPSWEPVVVGRKPE